MSIPGSASPLLLASTAAAGGYQIERSLRFNSADSAYLSRTPAVVGNRRTWTFATWIKGPFNATDFPRVLNVEGPSAGNRTTLRFTSDSLIDAYSYDGSNFQWQLTSSQVFRDPSAWFHLVLAVDTTQATSNNRVKLYINGAQVTAFSTANYPSLNFDTAVNHTSPHTIGGGQALSAYLSDIHFIDGQALTPSSFTEVSATTGQLIPKAYTGSFGTNGFKLTFSDNSNNTATTLGKDYGGNSNNWTPNNLSVTAGAGNDSLVDTPTSYGTDTGVGGEVRGNYCTWNPLSKGTDVTLANGNLDMTSSSTGGNTTCSSTFGVSSGKWYWEVTCTGSDPRNGIGVAKNGVNLNSYLGSDSSGWSYTWSAYKYNGSGASYGATYTANDVIGVALDADSGTLTFYKNGTSQGQAYNNLTSGPFFPAIADDSGGGVAGGSLNAGQRPFAYTAPSGFKALCDTNLPVPVVAKPSTVFDIVTRNGFGSAGGTVSSLSFAPDLIWDKPRSIVGDHYLFDAVRTVSKSLSSSTTSSESSYPNWITGTTSTGYTVGSSDWSAGTTVVEWCWNAGGSTVSNTQGSITSQVRANVSAGFSVVTWTSPSSGDYTIGHGLGVAPSLVITKSRSASGDQWYTFHRSVCTSTSNYLKLSSTDGLSTYAGAWGATLPTSTVVGLNAGGGFIPSSATAVAYCFAPVSGYSSFGSYTGNGSADGPFVYTGFESRWLLVKASSFTQGWALFDTAREPTNDTVMSFLQPNTSNAETGITTNIDILSNGFKPRANDGNINSSGQTYIYAAFAKSPFQYARAR